VTQLNLPVLDLGGDAAGFAAQIGASFREYGFAMVCGHGIDPALIDQGWRLTAEFFALPDTEKRAFHNSGQGGARGYTPFGTEIAKDAETHDLKEFWHIGRACAPDQPQDPPLPANVWPDRPAGFRATFERLFAEFDRVGKDLLQRIALDLGLSRHWFDPAIITGNSVLRLLHYPPLPSHAEGALRASPHEDINLITLLLGAEEAGLELLDRQGRWHAVNPPRGTLVVNIGDMLQRLTNRVLPSTTHRVINPAGAAAQRSRFSMPFFVHLRSDFPISTLKECTSSANPDQFAQSITADEFLQERLRQIGLL